MIPDLNRLKIFYYVHKHNSISAAAGELNITQSAVSQHLSKFEAEIRTRLFIRGHKKISPTAAGELLYGIIKPFIGELEEGLREIHRAEQGLSGSLRIGAPVEFGEKYLPTVMSLFRADYPGIDFLIELGHPSVLLPLVSQGRLDFAFVDIFADEVVFSRENSGLSMTPVAQEELIMVCSAAYDAKVLKGGRSFQALAGASYVDYHHHAPAVRAWFRNHFNRTSLHLRISLMVESVRMIISAVRHNMGLGVAPSHFMRHELETGELKHIQTGKPEMLNRISLIQLLDRVPGITEKAFLEHFRKIFGKF